MYDFTFDVFWVIDLVALIVAFTLFFTFFKRRGALKVGLLALFVVVLAVAANVFYVFYKGQELLITKTILDYAVIFTLVSFCSVYQSSLKAFCASLSRGKTKEQAVSGYVSNDEELSTAARDIVRAVQNMAKNDIGGIIIIAPTAIPEHILKSGTVLNAELSTPLLESIFNKKSPLHDGAVIVRGNRILAAGCFLPLSQEISISKDLGTRHRAAIGITEESDVMAIVVSEETGVISLAQNAQLKRYMTPEKLLDNIEKAFGILYQPAKNNFFRKK